MVSFDSQVMVIKVIVLFLAQFLQKAIYCTPFFFYFLSSAWIMILDKLTSCFSFLTDVARSIISLAISSDNSFDNRSNVPTWKMEWLTRTAPFRWFYVIIHGCCFCTWEGFNKHFTICIHFFVHFPSIKVFYHTASEA